MARFVTPTVGTVLAAAALLAGCHDDDEPREAAGAPKIRVLGATRQTGPPDAGTAGGHGADLVVAAYAASTVVHGKVRPPTARVQLVKRGGRPVAARVDLSGRFTVAVAALHPGANDFTLRASSRGGRAVARSLRIVRRPPLREVVVPEVDRSPPEVLLRVVGRDGRTLVSTRGELAPHRAYLPRVDLNGPLWAIATARDFDGGTARIRVSRIETVECRARAGGGVRRVRAVRYIPPPAIARVRITAGTRVPTARTRKVAIGARPGVCRPGEEAAGATVNLWGEANNAHGLESVSSHLQIRQR